MGVPLHLDHATQMRRYVHFARVLVDIDLAGPLPNTIWVERKDNGFHVKITYERLLSFCRRCNTIGHLVANCRSRIHNYDGGEGHLRRN